MRQNILTIVFVAIILATGWVWFSYVRRSGTIGAPAPASQPESETVRKYRRFQVLKFDTDIFSDALFQALERPASSGSQPAPSPGRTNPFAPF